MNPAIAIVFFYGLLALAMVILRGDLTEWPRWADRGLSFAVALSAVVLLLKSWRPAEPPAVPSLIAPRKPSPLWPWWAGLLGFLAFVYLAALPPVSTWLAQPHKIQRSTTGRDAVKPEAPPSTSPDATQVPATEGGTPLPNGTDPAPTTSPGPGGAESQESGRGERGVSQGGSLEAALDRLRERWGQNPPWLSRLALVAALILIGFIIWLLWRLLRPAKEGAIPSPGQLPVWYEDPKAPRYVREFARLCDRLGCPPRPGDTFRDLLARLCRDGYDIIELMPMTAYHYRVRYENAPSDRTAERGFSQRLRALRKAAISAPATETTMAASTAH
jgi:hypothetical protein